MDPKGLKKLVGLEEKEHGVKLHKAHSAKHKAVPHVQVAGHIKQLAAHHKQMAAHHLKMHKKMAGMC